MTEPDILQQMISGQQQQQPDILQQMTQMQGDVPARAAPPEIEKKLPFLAKGWTPKGEAYYGEGFQGWSSQFLGRMFDPESYRVQSDKDLTPEQRAQREQTKKTTAEALANAQIELLPDPIEEWFGQLTGSDPKSFLIGANTTMQNLGQDPLMATQFITQSMGGVGGGNLGKTGASALLFGGLQVGEYVPRWGFSGAQALDDMVHSSEIYRDDSEIFSQENINTQWNVNFLDKQINASATGIASNLWKLKNIHDAEGRGLWDLSDKERAIMDANLKASNMVYTSWFDGAAHQRAVKAIMNGEKPTFVLEEEANPWIELGGSLLFDFSNLLGGAGSAADIKKGLSMVVNPDLLKALDGAKEAAKLGDAANTLERYREVASVFAKTVGNKADVIENLAKTRNITSLQDSEKAVNYSKRMGRVFSVIAGMTRENPDEFGQIVTDMLKAGNGDAEAVMRLHGSKFSNLFFSDDGTDAIAMITRYSDEFGGLKKFKDGVKAAKNAEELLAFVYPKLEKVAKSAFPTIEDLERAKKAVDAGDVSVRARKLASAWDDLPAAQKAASKADRAASLVRDPINEALGLGFFGTHGYAVRNNWSDTLKILWDLGPKAAGRTAGTHILDFFSNGAVSRRWAKEGSEWAGGYIPKIEGLTAIDSEVGRSAGLVGKVGDWLKKAGPMQANPYKVAKQGNIGTESSIFYSAVQSEMEKAIKLGLPATSELENFGLTPQLKTWLIRETLSRRGDVRGAVDAMRRAFGDGVVEIARNKRMKPALQEFLMHTGKLDGELYDIMRTGTREDFVQAADAMYKQITDIADAARKEAPMLDRELMDGMEPIMRAADVGDIEEVDRAMFIMRRQVSHNVDLRGKTFIKNFMAAIEDLGVPTGKEWGGVLDRVFKNNDVAWEESQKFTDAVRKLSDDSDKMTPEQIAKAWDNISIGGKGLGPPPAVMTPQALKEAMWPAWKELVRNHWGTNTINTYERTMKVAVDTAQKLLADRPDQQLEALAKVDADYQKLTSEIELAKKLYSANGPEDLAAAYMKSATAIGEGIPAGTAMGAIDWKRVLPKQGWKGGIQHLVNAVSKDTGVKYASLDEALQKIPLQDALEALAKRSAPFPPLSDNPQTLNRVIAESMEGYAKDFTEFTDSVVADWGKTEKAFGNPKLVDGLEKWATESEKRIGQARLFAIDVANSHKDFAVHAYGGDKTNLDRLVSYVFPYSYWHLRETPKTLKRIVNKPSIFTGYMKYRRALEQKHAGMPEFYKYSLTTADLPGLNLENDVYFNIEATLNPLNGLTGVDFNDSEKRATWYSRMYDDLGKFGPTQFTPMNWLMAAALYSDGEEEAASRFLGRIIPQSQVVKSAAYAAGINIPGTKYNEIDPIVRLAHGGIDPYERKRVGYQAMALQEMGYSEEQIIDAFNKQEGPIWDQAVALSQKQRAGGNLASYFLGVGFKSRSKWDMDSDIFYNKYFSLMDMRPNLSPEEFRLAMIDLKKSHPYMDALLIARKPGQIRDTAYAYNVLNRIPPGQMTDLAKLVDVRPEMLNQFYESKGTFKGWTPQDIDRFNAGITDLGALLSIPEYATQQRWSSARATYSQMQDAVRARFGDDIYDKIGDFYDVDTSTPQGKKERDALLAKNPEIQAALDMQQQAVATNPFLYQYYGGIQQLEFYYRGKMYKALSEEFGNLDAVRNEYSNLQLTDSRQAARFYRAHPELKAYSKRKAELQKEVTANIIRFGSYLPDKPEIGIREDAQAKSDIQQEFLDRVNQPQVPSWQEMSQMMNSDPLERLVVNYLNGGELSSAAERQLDWLATQYGFASGDQFLQFAGIAYSRNR